jgi:hypothetical protein
MASVLFRLLAAIRGAGISSLSGREPGPHQPQIRRVDPRGRENGRAASASADDRAMRISEFRVKRLRQIAAFYADAAHEAVVTVADCAFLPQERFPTAAEIIVRSAGDSASSLRAREDAVRKAMLKRRLAELTDRERATLRAADLLCELGEFERAAALRVRLPIVWNEGRCQITAPGFESATRRNFLRLGLETLFGEFADATPETFDRLRGAWRNALSLDSTLSEEEHQTLETYQFVERAWLAPPEPPARAPTPAALTLGQFAGTERELVYDDGHGLITFAPPPSTRPHAQIAHNLARLATGAVVVDIDGRAFHATARGRQRELGRILAFAPALADHSMHYNPIEAVGHDPDTAWSGARLLAELMTGRRGLDEEARSFVAPAIYDVALGDRPERRHMRGVLARISCSDEQLDAWCAALERSPHEVLVRHGETLRRMPRAKREALASRVMRELAVWQSPPIADLLDRSDWTPDELRRRATLYLCVDRRDLDRYAVVLRTIVGQTIAALGRDKALSPGSSVTLFLDGAARLGPMGTVARAVDSGPETGVRPWMFFASGAEMHAVYPDADGMAANCAAHCYAEPDAATAAELALRLGFVKSLFGADEKPVVTADELMGADFADEIVALVRGQAPARLVLPGEAKSAQRRGR